LNAPAGRGSWRLDFYSQGLEIAGPLAEFINRQLRVALKELGRRVLRVHVRLYGTAGECTCYIRVDLVGNKGFARGDAAEDASRAVQRAADRIRAAALDLPGASLPCGERTR
jgi:hypothetical protein